MKKEKTLSELCASAVKITFCNHRLRGQFNPLSPQSPAFSPEFLNPEPVIIKNDYCFYNNLDPLAIIRYYTIL
jgi:hypothetical protein